MGAEDRLEQALKAARRVPVMARRGPMRRRRGGYAGRRRVGDRAQGMRRDRRAVFWPAVQEGRVDIGVGDAPIFARRAYAGGFLRDGASGRQECAEGAKHYPTQQISFVCR